MIHAHAIFNNLIATRSAMLLNASEANRLAYRIVFSAWRALPHPVVYTDSDRAWFRAPVGAK